MYENAYNIMYVKLYRNLSLLFLIMILQTVRWSLNKKMLEMQYAFFELINDLEKIAEVGEQIRGVVEEILPTDNGTTTINAFLA